MKKTETIVVRQPKGLRFFYLFLLFVLCVSLILFLIASTKVGLAMAISIGVSMIAVSVPFLYYYLWRISFSSKSITISLFIWKKEYSYFQVKEILKYNTGLWGERIWIDFVDGKRITIKSNYENYSKAIQLLRRHRPIHTA